MRTSLWHKPAVSWEPRIPKPTTTVGCEGRMLQEGDEVELPEAEGERLVEAGVLEAPKATRRRTKK